MQETYIKVYDWTISLDVYERLIFSLIHQYTGGAEFGYWSGYKTMSERVGLPKSKCKAIVDRFAEEKKIIKSYAVIRNKNRLVLASDPSYVKQLKQSSLARV